MKNEEPKKISIYGIYTTDDEFHGSLKAFAVTRKLAIEELKKYRDYGEGEPPKADKYHIKRYDLILGYDKDVYGIDEENPPEYVNFEREEERINEAWEEIGNKLYKIFEGIFKNN